MTQTQDIPFTANRPQQITRSGHQPLAVDSSAHWLDGRLWLLIIPVLLLTFWLGARGLNIDPIWNDEWYSIRDARAGVTPLDTYIHVSVQNPWHTPGYFIVLKQWINIVSWGPFQLRLLSLLFGLLTVAWTYRLGRDLVSPLTGLLAGAIVGSSAFLVYHMHEVRMYTLTPLLAAFTLWAYFRIMRGRREPSPLLYVGLFIGSVSMLYMHYFAALPLAAIGIYHVVIGGRRIVTGAGGTQFSWRRWWLVVAALGVAGLLFLPWVSALMDAVKMASRSEQRRSAALNVDESLFRMLILFGNGSLILLIITGAVGLWRRLRDTWTVWYFAAASIAMFLVANGILRVMSEGRSRYMTVLFPLLALPMALGIVGLWTWRPKFYANAGRYAALILAAAWLGWGYYHTFRQDITDDLSGADLYYPVHTVMYELYGRTAPGDYIVNYLPDGTELRRYSHNVHFYVEHELLAADHGLLVAKDDPAELETDYAQVMTEIGLGREYVWLAYMPTDTPSTIDSFRETLSESYAYCGTPVQRSTVHVAEYARSVVCCRPENGAVRPQITYDGEMALRAASIPALALADTLPVRISWLGTQTLPPETHSVALHVLNADGELVAQADYGLPYAEFACPYTEIDIRDLPDGSYTVHAIVYNWQTLERLSGESAETGVSDSLPIGTFRRMSQ